MGECAHLSTSRFSSNSTSYLFVYERNFFLKNVQYLHDLISSIDKLGGGTFLIHYIAPAHILGVITIVFSWLPSWAIIAKPPILIGDILVNFMGEMHSKLLQLALFDLGFCVAFYLMAVRNIQRIIFFKIEQ